MFGLSTQITNYQKEMVERLELPFPVLSDHEFKFCNPLQLPTFTAAGMVLLKRVTIIASCSTVDAIHYPVFPTDTDPHWVIEQLMTDSGN